MKLVDLRNEQEHRLAHIEGDILITEELVQEIREQWAKDTPLALYCHYGNMSLEAAAFLSQQGFSQVKSLRGGVDAWSQ